MVPKNRQQMYKEKPIEQGTIDKVLFDICLEKHQLYNRLDVFECNRLDIHFYQTHQKQELLYQLEKVNQLFL